MSGYTRRRTQQDSVLDNLIWLQRTRSARLGLADTPELPPTTGRAEHHRDDTDGSAPCNVDGVEERHSRGPTGAGSAPSAGRAGSRSPRRG